MAAPRSNFDLDVRRHGRRGVEAARDLEHRLVRFRRAIVAAAADGAAPQVVVDAVGRAGALAASCSRKPASSPQAISISAGIERGESAARAGGDRGRSPRATTCVAFSIAAISASDCAISGRRERRRHRIARVRQGARLERRQHDLARERFALVEHVRAHGAGGQRMVADLGELARLPEVERDGDDIGVVMLGEPLAAADERAPPEYASTTVFFNGRGPSASSPPPARPSASRAMIRMVSSPASVPATSSQARAIDRQPEQLRLPGPGLEHDELLHRLDVDQVLGERARRARRCAVGRRCRLGAGRLIRAVRRALQQAELLDVARQRGLRHVEAARRQPLPQLFLAAHGFLLHDVENGGLPPALHIYTSE